MTLWWLQPGWTDTCCAQCGAKIYPEGDPDWGLCFGCFTGQLEQQRMEQERERDAEERYRQEMAEMEEHYRRHPHG